MNESAEQGERDAASRGIVIGPGEGRTIPGTGAITLIATAEQTGGSIGVFEGTSSGGDGPPRHVHYGSDELFYILEGEFLFLVGERQASVSAGTYVFEALFPLPESPRWLLAKDRRQDALGVLRRIRHEEHNPEAELAEIEAVHKMQAGVGYGDLFKPSVRPALIVGVGIAFFNQMVGVNAVIYYAPSILEDAGFSASAAILATTGVGIVNMLVTLCALLLIDRLGRRPLLLIGMSGVLLSLLVLGGAYLLPGDPSAVGFLLVAGLMVYIASFAASLGIAIWLLNSEVYRWR